MGIENLQLWRTEPFQSTFQKFFADKAGLEHKFPLQGRWFSSTPYYNWLGPDTVMKELETKFPFQYYDKAGQVEIPGEGFTMKSAKTAAELAKDRKVISEWIPIKHGRTGIIESFKTPKAQKDWNKYIDAFWKRYKVASERDPLHEGVGRYTDNPVKTYPRWLAAQKKLAELRIPMTEFEATGLPRVMTPPLDIANQAKVNLWESFKQNFMKPDRPFSSEDIYKKGIHYPKSRLENIMRIPNKVADIYGRYKAGQPIKSGIPWSKIGMGLLNNPVTRTAGWLGNVALGGQALLDIGTGSQHTKNMMTDINRMTGVPVDRQGNAITNIRDYRNLQKVAQRDVLNPNEMRGVTSFDTTRYNPREMNTGGIVSLMV